MKRECAERNDKYEIIIRKLGGESPLETDIMDDWGTREVLHLIGKLNLRSAYAG